MKKDRTIRAMIYCFGLGAMFLMLAATASGFWRRAVSERFDRRLNAKPLFRIDRSNGEAMIDVALERFPRETQVFILTPFMEVHSELDTFLQYRFNQLGDSKRSPS